MKEFMMIFLGADYQDLQLSPEEIQSRMQLWMDWIGKLNADGTYLEGRPLMPGVTRMAGEKPIATDGPFAETKELIGGYFIVQAADLEKAKEMALDFPDFDLGGTVELREVMKM